MILYNSRKAILSIFILCFLLINPFKSNSQPILTNPFVGSYFQPSFGINMGTFFNHEDFLFDFGLGFEELGYDYSVTFNGSFRPYYKKVIFKETDNLYYQVQEKVLQFSIDAEKRFYFIQFMNSSKIGLYAMMKFGYFYGTYKGLKENRNNTFALTPGAGLSWQFSKVSRVNLGYLYFNQNPFASPHMINLKLSIFINKDQQQ
jgi:opacity protein-like surface antigen